MGMRTGDLAPRRLPSPVGSPTPIVGIPTLGAAQSVENNVSRPP